MKTLSLLLCVAVLDQDGGAQGVPVVPIMQIRSAAEAALIGLLEIPVLNALIGAADADAVARGKLAEPTGLTVSGTLLPTD